MTVDGYWGWENNFFISVAVVDNQCSGGCCLTHPCAYGSINWTPWVILTKIKLCSQGQCLRRVGHRGKVEYNLSTSYTSIKL